MGRSKVTAKTTPKLEPLEEPLEKCYFDGFRPWLLVVNNRCRWLSVLICDRWGSQSGTQSTLWSCGGGMAKHLAVRQQSRATSSIPSKMPLGSQNRTKGPGEGPAGRKGDVTKVLYLLNRIIKILIYNDTGPTNKDSENNPKVRAAQRAAWKTPGDTILMVLG